MHCRKFSSIPSIYLLEHPLTSPNVTTKSASRHWHRCSGDGTGWELKSPFQGPRARAQPAVVPSLVEGQVLHSLFLVLSPSYTTFPGTFLLFADGSVM